MDFYKVAFLATFLVLAEAGPVYNRWETDQGACAQQCFDHNKFDYQPGTVYQFSYDAKTTTKMNGASEDSANIDITANVEIEPLTKCELVMKITAASLHDSLNGEKSEEFQEAMMKQPLKFSFQDGRIDHVCAMDGESTWILNIKRGILSAFQNSMDSFDRNQNLTETDVVGTCLSEYKIVSSDRKTERIEKTKSLLGCSDREAYRLAIQSIGYNVPATDKSLPLMKSEYKCTQTLDLNSNILQSSTCSEEHVFRPFSYGKNGAMTSNKQTLVFEKTKKAGRLYDETFNHRTSLLFEHQFDIDSRQEREGEVEEKLRELCQAATDDVRPELPEMMNQLAASMREVNTDVFLRIYAKITRPNFCSIRPDLIKRYFLDAIPMVGTLASLKTMEEFISKKYVTGSDIEMWMLSLSFIQRPSREMVAAVIPLLDIVNITENAFLAISSLASGYCSIRPECGKDSEISTLNKKLLETVNYCNTQTEDSRRITVALRAIGNIGHSQEPVSHLSRCLTNRDIPASMRIAAMDAFRRIPCEATRSDLMGVFRDESEDSEIRINAYIALMKCPSQKVLSEVRQVLEKETTNQVGSFVWSHLTNLMETSDPHMQDIRNIVQDEELKKEFNLDQRKFSRNYEGSFFFDSINTGAKVDSNVIFSHKSFIPRSANLNLTIDLFGQAINFLEIGGRVQSPSSYSWRKPFKPEHIGILKNKNKFEEKEPFSASSYLRVFGNELRYWDTAQIQNFDPLSYIFNKDRIHIQTLGLVDSAIIIPTCLGLPLNLSVTATGSIHMNTTWHKNDIRFLKLAPSAALQIKGEMSVDAHLTKAGLKMVSTAHTSTAVTFKYMPYTFAIEIPKKKAEIFNLRSDFFIVQRNIDKKQQMLKDNIKNFTICSGKKLIDSIGLSFCQHVQFPNASHSKETPYFPFTGPVVYDLHIRNEDVPNAYELSVDPEMRNLSFTMDTPGSKVRRKVSLNFQFIDKMTKMSVYVPWRNLKFEGMIIKEYDFLKITGNLSLNNKSYSMLSKVNIDFRDGIQISPYIKLMTPTKNMIYRGNFDYVHNEKFEVEMSTTGFGPENVTLKVSGKIQAKEISAKSLMRIGKKEYMITASLGKNVLKNSAFKYVPYLKITVPNRDIMEITSEVNYDPDKKFTFDFKLDKLFSRPITTNVFAVHNEGKGKHIFRVLFKAPRGNFRVTGDISKKKSARSSRIIASYSFGPKYSDRLTFSSKLRDLSLKNSARYLGIVELSSKKKEFLNFKLNGNLAKASNHLETNIDLQYGSPKNKATNTLKFSAVGNRSLKPLSHSYSYTMSIQHPGQNVDYKVDAEHKQSAKWPFKKFENKVTVQLAPGEIIKTLLSYNNAKVKGLPSHEGEIALSYPGRDMTLADKLTQVNKNAYENHFTVQWQKGQQATVQSTYTKTGKDIHNIENILTLPNKKVAKATAMLQAKAGAYKTEVVFDAEENSICKDRMLYSVEASVINANGGKRKSRDIKLDVAWSPVKSLSVNIGSITTDSSISHKLTFSTPFPSLKNFDGEAKYAWNNGKYASTMKLAWNKQNEFWQEFSITHPGKELELNYLASSDMKGKKSFLKFTASKVGPKVTGQLKLNVFDSPTFQMMLSHTNEKKYRKTEGSFSFHILETDADFKMSHTYYPLKDEIILVGKGKLNLPFKNLKEISTSYSLNHNSQVSSIDIDYSTSLNNYKNGKLTAEITRNLPKLLKGKMQLTQMDKEILSLEAKYQRKGSRFNINVDITDPQSEKIETVFNLDLSAPRKTCIFETKSKYINLSVDGGFEFKNGRFMDGELKVIANGQNMKMSANYLNDDGNHKLTGSLQLPDGRSIDGKIGLMLKDTISLSLMVNSPDFPSLTNIDINLIYNGDEESSVMKGYAKVLPYLKESEFEASFSTKENFNLAFVLKTPFGNMRNVKATLSLPRNQENSKTIKSEFELNNNKVMDLEFSYNVKSIQDFSASFDLKTSHRRLDVVSLLIKHSGDFYDMQSLLKAKIGREMKIYGKIRNSASYNEVALKGEFKDFDDFELSFLRVNSLDDMNATLLYKHEGKEVFKSKLIIKGYGTTINAMTEISNILNFSFESEVDMENISFNLRSNMKLKRKDIYRVVVTYEHLAKLYMKSSFPSYNDELTLTLNGDLKMFNALAKLIHNTNKYELIISNQGYYRKMDAQLITPFFTEMASFIFNGDQETFNAQVKFMHDNDQYELVVSNRNHYQQMTITLSTPFSSDNLDIDFEGDLSSFSSLITFTHNKVVYKLEVSNDEYFRNINVILTIPSTKIELLFELKGNLQTFNSMTSFTYNEKKVVLVVFNKDYYRQISINLTTPLSKDSLSFSVDGNLNSFNAKLKYMHYKELYELVVHNSGFYREIEAKLSTPYFRDMLSISVDGKLSDFTVQVKVMHNHKNYQITISKSRNYRNLSLELTTPFYEGSLDFSLKGNLQSFNMVTKVLYNNEKFQLTVSNVNYYRQMKVELLTPYFKGSVDFLFKGNLRKFNAHLSLRYNKILYEIKASNQEFYRQMDFQLTTPFVSCHFQFEGTLQAVDIHLKLNIGKAKYECLISTKKSFQISELTLTIPRHTLIIKSNIYYKKKSITGDINASFDGKKCTLTGFYKDTGRKKIIKVDLKTPYFEERLQGTIAGTLQKFNANMKLQHNNDAYEIIASNKNYCDELDLNFNFPGMKIKFQSEGNVHKCKVSTSLKMATDLYEVNLSNQNYFQNINLEISAPQTGKCSFDFAFQGNWKKFDVESKFSQRNNNYGVNISIDRKTGEYGLKLVAPQIKISGHFNGDLKSLSFNSNLNITMFNSNEMKLRIVSEGFQKTDIMLNLKSPWTGMTNIFYEHNGQMGKSFNTKGYIERDGTRFVGYSLDTSFEDGYSFDIKCDYSNSQNIIEVKGDLKFQGVKTMATLNVNTPFRNFKEVFITVQTKLLRDGPSIDLDIKLPNQDYSLNIDLSNSNFNALFNVNMDKKNKDKQYQFQTSYKNTDQRADISRSFNFKMVLPERTVSLDSRFGETEDLILASTEVTWNDIKHQKIGVEIEFNKGNKKSFKCKLITPRRNVELFGSILKKANHSSAMGYIMLDADRSPQKIEAKADVIGYSNGKDVDLLLKFPNQKNGMRIKTFVRGAEANSIFSSKSELSIDQDPAKTLTVDVKLNSERQNYTLDCSVTHPSTDFSLHMLSFVAFAPDHLTSAVNLTYNNVKKQQQNFMIRSQIHQLKREFNLKMEAPSKKIELSGFIKTANLLVMSAKKSESDKDDMEAILVVNPNALNIRMDLNYDQENPSKVYRLDASVRNQRAVLKAYRMEGRKGSGTDTRIIAELRPSHILFLNLRWNPNLLRDFNKFLYQKLSKFGAEVKTFGLKTSEILSKELTRRFELAEESLMADLQPVMKYFETEHESFYRDVSRYLRNFNEHYKKNNFYLQTIKTWLNRVWSDMWAEYKMMAYNFQVKMNEASEFISIKLEEFGRNFDLFYGKSKAALMEKMSKMYRSLEEYVRQVKNYYFSMIHDVLYSLKNDIVTSIEQFPDVIKEFLEDMKHHPFGSHLFAIWSKMNDSINNTQMNFNNRINEMSAAVSSAKDAASRHFRDISALNALMGMIDVVYEEVIWAYRYWNVKSNLLSWKDLIEQSFYSKVNEWKRTLTDFDINTLVFAPKRGEISVEFRYAAAMQVYNFFESIAETVEEIQQMFKKFQRMLPDNNLSFWDIYYMIKSRYRAKEFFLPDTVRASLFRGQYISTFDGHHFQYKGTCSYLMTRDFVDGHFTVVVNYDPDKNQKTIKSITVTINKDQIVEIFSDYKVKHKGEYTDLPILGYNYSVVRERNQIILKSYRSFQLTADLQLGLYNVDISGRYFAHVAGMFGNFNYETNDDMIMYNGNQTDNLEEFAASWVAEPSVCKSTHNLAPSHIRVPENQECYHLFVDNYSPFRNCFRQVNPDVFYDLCKNLTISKASEICNVSAFYMGECQRKGVDLQMPKSCVRCTGIMGNKFYQGEDMTLVSSRAPAADVIFIVEEIKYNPVAPSRIADIVKHLTSILEQKGLHDSKFGLMGIGKSRSVPSFIHTIDGEMMFDSEKMMKILNNMTFPYRRYTVDPMKAIMMAGQYSFRPGVRKTVVFVPYSRCHEIGFTSWELSQMLEKYDITLHVLADQGLKTKINLTSKTTNLYGADKSHAYSEGLIDAETETNIVIPEDNCIQVALESGGSYFDSKKLQTKETVNISFMEKFAERISESLMPNNCESCNCVPDQSGRGQTICKKCPSNLMKHNIPMDPVKEFSSIPGADEDFHKNMNDYLRVKSH